MRSAGFLLAGGLSRRMGTDKALLAWGSGILLTHQLELLAASAGSGTIVAPAGRYEQYGVRVLADEYPGEGPLGAIRTILQSAIAEWNLVLACDLPHVPREALCRLVDRAASLPEGCLVPRSVNGRVQPICAAYHQSCLAEIARAFDRGERKLMDVLPRLGTHYDQDWDDRWLQNLNTPADWREARSDFHE